MNRHRGDGGAVSVIFAILLASGVLLGLCAAVVDVGQLYAARQAMLNSADAAAFAAAHDCEAHSPCTAGGLTLTGSPAAVAAAANSPSGQASVTVTCGSVGGKQLGSCPPRPTNLSHCVGTRPSIDDYVEVRTTAETKRGSPLLPTAFASAVLGPGYKGSTVSTCARVRWGLPASATVFPLGVSVCTIGSSPRFATHGPPYSLFDYLGLTGVMTILSYVDQACPSASGGPSMAWLNNLGSSGGCSLRLSVGTTVPGVPANVLNPGVNCDINSWNALEPGNSLVYLPVYDKASGGKYHIIGFVPFWGFFSNLPLLATWTWADIPGSIFQLLKTLGCALITLSFKGDCVAGFFNTADMYGQVTDDPSAKGFGLTAFQQIG